MSPRGNDLPLDAEHRGMHLVGTAMDTSQRSSRFVGNARTSCQSRSLSLLPEESRGDNVCATTTVGISWDQSQGTRRQVTEKAQDQWESSICQRDKESIRFAA